MTGPSDDEGGAMPAPLTRTELDRAVCNDPNCDLLDHAVLYFFALCHPNGGVDVAYCKRTGLLRVHCKVCEHLVTEVAVAP